MSVAHSLQSVAASANGGKHGRIAVLDLKVKLRMKLKLCLLLCFGLCCSLASLCQSVPLPPPTSAYYAVVSGGFGSLNFSFHYFEYGNTSLGTSHFLGRYFSPEVHEWTDPSTDAYSIQWSQPCQSFSLQEAQNTRLLSSAASFLVDLNVAGVQFTNLGDTNLIRMQPAVHFASQLAYTSSNKGTAQSVDAFLQQAYATAGVDNTAPYSVSINIDVYYSGSSSSFSMLGDGYIPLRFAISGTRTDAHGVRQLDIQFDFMMWAQLTEFKAEVFLTPPSYGLCYTGQIGDLPSIPPSAQLGPVNQSLPLNFWSSGRAAMEVSSSINDSLLPPQQLDALMQPVGGKLINAVLADPSDFSVVSHLYIYAGSSGFQFATGTVYTVTDNIIQLDVLDSPQGLSVEAASTGLSAAAAATSPCQTASIDATNASPMQSQNGGFLLSLFAKPGFTTGVQYIGRESIRGFVADTWSLTTTTLFNGTTYSFTLTLSATASGWNNIGRINLPADRQLLRLAFAGVSTPSAGSATHYTVDMDFFIQYLMSWDPNTTVFDPKSLCH